MKRLTINLRTAKDVEIEPSCRIGRRYCPGSVEVSHKRVSRFQAGEIFLVTVISADGKTKVVATAFHNGMGRIHYDGQQFDTFRKTRNGEWKKTRWQI